jgi:hypothetical protein
MLKPALQVNTSDNDVVRVGQVHQLGQRVPRPRLALDLQLPVDHREQGVVAKVNIRCCFIAPWAPGLVGQTVD